MTKEKTYITGHKKPDTDSICAAIAYAELKNEQEKEKYVAARAGDLNPETKFVLNKFNVEKPKRIKKANDHQIILVDHNETNQSIEGIEEAEIKEVLDHHRIAGLETEKPIYFHTEPVGSTSTLVAEKLFNSNISIEKDLAGILLSAILSDTVVHRSPTNTKKDQIMANKLAEIVDLEKEKYGKEMLKKKSQIGEKPPRDIILGDFKEYEMTDRYIGIGQVETVDPEEVLDKEETILEEMKNIINEREYDLLILLVTDLLEEDSQAYVRGEKEEFSEAFETEVEENKSFLKGVLSRKKQVVPKLEKQFD